MGVPLVLPEIPISDPLQYSQRLLVIDPIDGSPRDVRYQIFEDSQVLEKGVSAGGVQAQRKIGDEPEKLIALVGSKRKWRADYLVPDAPFPIERDENGV